MKYPILFYKERYIDDVLIHLKSDLLKNEFDLKDNNKIYCRQCIGMDSLIISEIDLDTNYYDGDVDFPGYTINVNIQPLRINEWEFPIVGKMYMLSVDQDSKIKLLTTLDGDGNWMCLLTNLIDRAMDINGVYWGWGLTAEKSLSTKILTMWKSGLDGETIMETLLL